VPCLPESPITNNEKQSEIMIDKDTPVHKERRTRPRIAFHLPVSIMGLNEDAHVLDFSVDGFFVQMDNPRKLKEGQQVRLALRFPHEKNSTVIKAKVIRTQINGFGCQVIDKDPLVIEMLEQSFDLFSATLPI
jgi:hypothetical protein